MTYLNISKIKASKLKEIGFKSKAIAKTFAKLSNIKAKKYETEDEFLNALKNTARHESQKAVAAFGLLPLSRWAKGCELSGRRPEKAPILLCEGPRERYHGPRLI